MNAVAKMLTKIFPGFGFALLVFDFHKPEMPNYVSNAQRATTIIALREMTDRLAGAQDIPPTKTIDE